MQKALKYTDLSFVYSQCSGPGVLKVAEFIADKMNLEPGKKLHDIGTNRGLQTSFLAKEYDLSFVTGIDPWDVKGSQHHMPSLTEVDRKKPKIRAI